MRTKLKIYFTASVLISFSAFTHAFQSESEQTRIDKLSKKLEAVRIKLKIPGMAITVVKDGKVLLSKGFGVSNIENGSAVDENTMFAIGSTTKAFTASLAGILVEEGKLSFDAPVTDYLPWYTPNLEEDTGKLTLRDMLSHRSGIARNDILWASGQVDSTTLLKESLDAIPLTPYKKNFNYNNVMFLAAGLATAKAAGEESWATLLKDKLLSPLGMNQTITEHSAINAIKNYAQGYSWNAELNQFDTVTRRNLDNIAPAGGLHSNVIDMAKWLKFNLAANNHSNDINFNKEELRQPHVKIQDNLFYGMGWMIQPWNGKKVIQHGGSVPGYASQVALIPEENIGFVLLTNVTSSPIQQGSMQLIWDALLNNATESDEESQDLNLSFYTNKYIANFGNFNNETFSVTESENKLYINIPGQKNFELLPPKEGKWYFAFTDTIAISFEQEGNNKASAMKLHQGGMTFELLPKSLVKEKPRNQEQFNAYLGKYTTPKFPAPIRALVQNGNLSIDVPGEMVNELELPTPNGHRNFKVSDVV